MCIEVYFITYGSAGTYFFFFSSVCLKATTINQCSTRVVLFLGCQNVLYVRVYTLQSRTRRFCRARTVYLAFSI